MATVNGARLMRLPDYGLEVGRRADLVVLDAPSVHEAEVAAVRARQDLDHGGRFSMRAHAQHDAFVGPVHDERLEFFRTRWKQRRPLTRLLRFASKPTSPQ